MKTGKKRDTEPWGPNYRWEHTLRVAHWAWILANEEGADVEKCVVSALFHDVSHFVVKEYRRHGEKSAEIATKYMTKAGCAKDYAKEVSYAVKSHVGERSPATIEAKILQDADTLDRFGLFRFLLFGKTADFSNLRKLKADIQSFLEYLRKVDEGEFGPMWTKRGKEKV
ncbi:MAG: HD domain-containing protein, partial [Candidatus Bathyarchaeia archaeon]